MKEHRENVSFNHSNIIITFSLYNICEMVMFYKLVSASLLRLVEICLHTTQDKDTNIDLSQTGTRCYTFAKHWVKVFFLKKLPDEIKNEQNHDKLQTLLYNFPVQGARYSIDAFCQIKCK